MSFLNSYFLDFWTAARSEISPPFPENPFSFGAGWGWRECRRGENGDVTVKTVSVAAALAVEAERGVVAGERRWGR